MLVVDEGQLQRIEDESKMLPVEKLAECLQDFLGQQMAAYTSGLPDLRGYGEWLHQDRRESDMAETRLRYTYHVGKLLSELFGPQTARAWLFGSNTRLGDEAPALIVRNAQSIEDLRGIVPAALSFIGSAPR